MTPFSYHRPDTLEAAVALLGESEQQAKVLAGGQSLLLALKDRLARPHRLMSIASLPGMKGVHLSDAGVLEVGAATTYATLSRMTLAGWHSEIAAVAGNLADRSVRSLGTVGGALCDANPRYDMPTLMVAVDAKLTLASSQGTRTVSASEFFNPAGGTVLQPSEILTRIDVPSLTALSGLVFEKFRHRVFDAAVLTVGCAFKLDAEGSVEMVRFVVGAVAKAPFVAKVAAAELVGKAWASIDAKAVARGVSAEVMPGDGLITRQRQYQSELIVSLTARALTRLFDQNRT